MIDLNGDFFFAWFIGYVDGDGGIGYQSGGRRDCALRIKVHKSWQEVLRQASEKIYESFPYDPRPVTINRQGYAVFATARQEVLRFLKDKMQLMSLPVLRRKWDKIQMEEK